MKTAKATEKRTDSAAYQIIALVWRNAQQATGHSWQRLESAAKGAMFVAIEAGFKFDLDDFARVYADFSGSHWFGHSEYNGDNGDAFYRVAVKYRNVSACRSFEAFARRSPFIYDGFRLACGSSIVLGNERWAVSSFDDEGGRILLCRSEYDEDAKRSKVVGRKSMTVDEVRALEKARKDGLARVAMTSSNIKWSGLRGDGDLTTARSAGRYDVVHGVDGWCVMAPDGRRWAHDGSNWVCGSLECPPKGLRYGMARADATWFAENVIRNDEAKKWWAL